MLAAELLTFTHVDRQLYAEKRPSPASPLPVRRRMRVSEVLGKTAYSQ